MTDHFARRENAGRRDGTSAAYMLNVCDKTFLNKYFKIISQKLTKL